MQGDHFEQNPENPNSIRSKLKTGNGVMGMNHAGKQKGAARKTKAIKTQILCRFHERLYVGAAFPNEKNQESDNGKKNNGIDIAIKRCAKQIDPVA